jgi:hypothetical protein
MQGPLRQKFEQHRRVSRTTRREHEEVWRRLARHGDWGARFFFAWEAGHPNVKTRKALLLAAIAMAGKKPDRLAQRHYFGAVALSLEIPELVRNVLGEVDDDEEDVRRAGEEVPEMVRDVSGEPPEVGDGGVRKAGEEIREMVRDAGGEVDAGDVGNVDEEILCDCLDVEEEGDLAFSNWV